MKNRIQIIFAIIAALIGAGFASGQEIYVFFYSYGVKGIFGLAICSISISYIIYKVLNIIDINKINSYKEFICFLVGNNNNKKYFNLGYIANIIINVFLLITFFIMIAGFGAYFSQELRMNSFIGSGILSGMCIITLIGSKNLAIRINSFLIPILILLIIVIGVINFTTIDIESTKLKIEKMNRSGWLLSSILYSSYNSIFLIPVIITLKNYINQKKDIYIVSIISGIIILVLAITIFSLITKIDIDIQELEMPVIYVISNYFIKFKIIYAFIILASIYTTAISIGIGILENIAKDKKSYFIIIVFMCITGLLVSGIGFSNLITCIYPIFGFLGLIQLFRICV